MFVRSIRGVVAAALLVAAASTVSQAQMASTTRFGVSVGMAAPTGDLGKVFDLGYLVGGQLTTGLGERLALRINVDLSRYGTSPAYGDETLMFISGLANIVFPIPMQSGFKPYLLAGVGMNNSKVTGGGSATDLVLDGGAGFDFMMGGRSWFTEVRYVSIRADLGSATYIPIVFGLKF